MTTESVRRWTGMAGIAATAASFVGVGLFFTAGLPPSFADAGRVASYLKGGSVAFQTAALLLLLGFASAMVFVAGLRTLVVRAEAGNDFLGSAVFALGVTSFLLGFASVALLITAVAESVSQAQPASVRTLFEASGILAGAPSLLPLAFFVGAAGSAVRVARLLPAWNVWLAWAASILVLLAVPSAYGGNDPNAFYSADGLVTIAAGVPPYLWLVATSIAILRAANLQS